MENSARIEHLLQPPLECVRGGSALARPGAGPATVEAAFSAVRDLPRP
ncbi:hypothetical protein [Streptomyces sp. NPDC001652]